MDRSDIDWEMWSFFFPGVFFTGDSVWNSCSGLSLGSRQVKKSNLSTATKKKWTDIGIDIKNGKYWFHLQKTKFVANISVINRGKWGYMKRKIVWGKVKHPCHFSAKSSLKFVSSKNKIHVSFCPMFHTAPFSPTLIRKWNSMNQLIR
jgi:hypothetical protein